MWKTILITLGIVIVVVIGIRIIVKWATAGEGLMEQAQGALSKIGNCCMRWLGIKR